MFRYDRQSVGSKPVPRGRGPVAGRHRIGEYPRGSQLPIEEQLAEQLGVHRVTVNRALSILRAEGLVYVRRGRGTFVTEMPPIRRNAVVRYSREARERSGGRGAFDTEITALGRAPRSDVTVSRVVPPSRVAAILGVSDQEQTCVRRARLMYADDTPVQIADSYIPLEIAAGTALEEQDSGPGGIISRSPSSASRRSESRRRSTSGRLRPMRPSS